MARNQEQTVEKPKARQATSKRQDAPRKGSKSSNAIIRYFQETRDELRKVSWPDRDETIRLTLIVLGTTLAFAIFLGSLDFLFQRLAGLLL